MVRIQPLGKLAVPDASGLLARERLYQRLDAALTGKLAWIVAPAGAGKTSLLAGWIRARQRPAIWYQVDAGDHDFGTFFHYLSLAARQVSRSRLPAATPENLMAPEAFARRYFTRLFQGWKQPCVWVLDNYQEISDTAPLHRLLDIALDLLPGGSLIVVASRHEAPASLRRHFAYAYSVLIGGDDLRLSAAESAQLAERWGMPPERAAVLHATSHGWAALQVLLMRLPPDQHRPDLPAGDALLFDYLSGEIYEKLDPDLRGFLAKVALPPFVTPALAAQLSGHSDTQAILSRLARQSFLTTRHGRGGTARYQFHPLLRAFLLDRLTRDFPAGEVQALRRQAALQLEQDGESETAAGLLADAQDWKALAALLRVQAPAWMAEGRMATLRQWLECLPEDVRLGDPWLLFWHGSILRLHDPKQARAQLEPAWRLFKAWGMIDGAFLAWAAIVESYAVPWSEYHQLPAWLEELDHLQKLHPEPANTEAEAQLLGTGSALLISAPFHPLIHTWQPKAEALILALRSPRHFGPLAYFITLHALWRGDSVTHTRTWFAGLTLPPRLQENHPLGYILFCICRAYLAWADLNAEDCRNWVAEGLETARTTGAHLLDNLLLAQNVYAATVCGDTLRAQQALDAMEPLLNPLWALDVHHFNYLRAGIQLMRGDTAAALKSTDGLSERVQTTGAYFPLMVTDLLRGQALALSGQAEAAHAYLSRPLEFAQRFPSPQIAFQAGLLEAYIALQQGADAQGLAALQRALAAGRRIDSMALFPFWLPQLVAPLCARALEAGIEADYVRRLIRRRGLLPESPASDTWPWPVRIFTLGRFAVLLDDQPVACAGKAQKRPLQLIKALIAHGGRGVSATTLAQSLWADDAEDSRHALDMTLSRLRKLLGNEAAILTHDGKLSLNDKHCWLDIWAFERLSGNAERLRGDGAPAVCERAMAHYAGPFLGSEDAAVWLLPRRERLRSRYIRLALAYGDSLEQAADWQAAVSVFRRALEIEPLAEVITQRLMTTLLAHGEQSQALEAFRRCREMLSIVLGVNPSARTQSLAEQAKG
ncbi:BTAD domain-containing putative transcriptional regulator [Thiobacillus sp.]|uniref:BTAD domain-containing putative transcriptional regulator n=1 Tax=Thiobacillus sp. TaxID=924 RepID=UPI00286DE263|nr:BTAD domain-containing putative transcriptional regulator [Thiobacillus sp.]